MDSLLEGPKLLRRVEQSLLPGGGSNDVQPAQIGFSAIAVPPGAHRIEWQERVPGGEISRFGFVLSLAVAAGLLAKDLRRT